MSEETTERSERESRPSPIDVHVGSRIRLRRTLLGMSQERLGDALGLTFQQVQKYERGVNRVGASRLFDISRVLDVPISFFFEDMPEGMDATPISGPARVSSTSSDSRTMELSATLQIVRVARYPARRALRSAAKVSAVSPDWEMVTNKVSGVTTGSR